GAEWGGYKLPNKPENITQVGRRVRQPRPLDERTPLGSLLLVLGKTAREPDRLFRRNRRSASFEGRRDGLGQRPTVEVKPTADRDQVVVVLHAAVRDADRADRLDLLGHGGFRRVSPDSRRIVAQQWRE